MTMFCRTAAVAAVALLVGCAAYAPALKAGDSIETATATMGAPTGRHGRSDGGTRLEFARGPYGKHTYMLDFDAQGRLLQWEQVLDEAHFAQVQAGLTVPQLRYQLGSPVRIWQIHYRDQTVYSYRFDSWACQLFHVGISPAGVVEDTSFGPDPLCERRDRFGRD